MSGTDRARGAWAAAASYAIWGLFPLYFHALAAVSPLHMLAQRIAWSLATVLLILVVRRRWAWLAEAWAQPRVLAIFAASGFTLAANWYLYIWAVQQGHVVETSLGYFINPLVNVVIAALVLREHLRRAQWAAVALAAAGVVWLTVLVGRPPWIALGLALSFAAYGLQRKLAPLGALEGLALESAALAPWALLALAWWHQQGTLNFTALPTATQVLIVAAGPITAVPLLLFAWGARRIPFALLGLLQYIGPTLQLLIGVLVMHEPFTMARLVGFALIWLALLLYTFESWWRARSPAATLAGAAGAISTPTAGRP